MFFKVEIPRLFLYKSMKLNVGNVIAPHQKNCNSILINSLLVFIQIAFSFLLCVDIYLTHTKASMFCIFPLQKSTYYTCKIHHFPLETERNLWIIQFS
jgi:hypothetical protein